MDKPIFRHTGTVKNKKIIFDNLDLFNKNVVEYEGQRVQFYLEPEFIEKSNDQLGYLFGGIIPTAMQHESFGGWTKDEFLDFIETTYLSYPYVKNINGEDKILYRRGRLSSLSKKKMNEVIEKFLDFLAGEGIEVMPPGQYKLTKIHKR